MRSQSARDDQTVTIGTTLALIMVVMLVGVAVVWLLNVAGALSNDTESRILWAAFVAAVLIGGRYLIRHRRDDQPRDEHRLS